MNPSNDDCRVILSSPLGLVVDLDCAVYRLSAVKKASYKFGDRFHIKIETLPNGWARVTLKAKVGTVEPVLAAGEFCNEVLDQELREVVANETATIRDLLLAHAFCATDLLDQSTDAGNANSDPSAISVPDEQKTAGR